MRDENKEMKRWLESNDIYARVKLIRSGSLAGCWRLYNPKMFWSELLADKLNKLGFTDFDGKPLGIYSGNGGFFSVFARKRGGRHDTR